ncbi:MAG: hypothetical protein L0956_07930 [Candidatus Mariimomonas ferrooxydans]
MKIIKNEKGIALVMVLIMSAIALAVMAQLIYFVTQGTKISGMEKRYKTALESGRGGADLTYEVIGARGDPSIPGITYSIPAEDVGGTDCLIAKLNTFTDTWPVQCDSSLIIDPGDITTYDITFSLGTAPLQYDVYAKIADTVEGNTGGDEGLLNCGVVCSNPGEVQVVQIPYLYTIEVNAQNSTNVSERAKLSILYQY